MTDYIVSPGQTISGIFLQLRDTVEILPGGTTVSLTDSWQETIFAGGIDLDTTVAPGGLQVLFGTAAQTVIGGSGRFFCPSARRRSAPVGSPSPPM